MTFLRRYNRLRLNGRRSWWLHNRACVVGIVCIVMNRSSASLVLTDVTCTLIPIEAFSSVGLVSTTDGVCTVVRHTLHIDCAVLAIIKFVKDTLVILTNVAVRAIGAGQALSTCLSIRIAQIS